MSLWSSWPCAACASPGAATAFRRAAMRRRRDVAIARTCGIGASPASVISRSTKARPTARLTSAA